MCELTDRNLLSDNRILGELRQRKEQFTLTIKDNSENAAAAQNVKNIPDVSKLIQSFKKKAGNTDSQILSKALEILGTILNEPQNRFCLEFAVSLNSYVEWIFTHSLNVSVISLMIAIEQEFYEQELYQIGLGAFLHDVGKLTVPKSIIQKPGALDDNEMLFIRRHCEDGIRLLSPFCISKECRDIVWQHHERLDGSGYPKGLKSGEIGTYAEIVMTADVIDAVTSARPYKKAQRIDDAIMILKKDQEKFSAEFINSVEKILRTE